MNMKKLYPGLLISVILSLGMQPAHGNCNDRIGSLEYFQPAMGRNWKKLQAQTSFPWGNTQVLGSLEQETVKLKPEFNQLTGHQKQQVIKALKLDRLFDDLTDEEAYDLTSDQKKVFKKGFGAIAPYVVRDYLGRLVYKPYDGCTSVIMVTERDRYSYYYTRRPMRGDRIASPEALRNSGQPFWRGKNFAIDISSETQVRHTFWASIGYEKAIRSWWIAWVPEIGHFEINVTSKADLPFLTRFWSIAPSNYAYKVLLKDGTPIYKRDAL